MIKDIVPTPMEPFTAAEEDALDERLGGLSVEDLRRYIESAKSSLGNKALAATWRPRIEIGMRHAETALVKGEAAAAIEQERAALEAAQPAPPAPPPKSRSKKAAAAAAAAAAESELGDA